MFLWLAFYVELSETIYKELLFDEIILFLHREVLRDLMSKEMETVYPEHALKTLARHYADDKYIGLKVDDLASRIRTDLYRLKYYDFEDLKLAMEIQDEEKYDYK